MKAHYQKKNDPRRYSLVSRRKVNKTIFKSNINVVKGENNKDKYDRVPDFEKKSVFVLKDCSVVLKDIWDDPPLRKFISRKYAIANNKRKCAANKKINVQLMKAKALKDGKKLRVCLHKLVQHDENSNIVSRYTMGEFRNLWEDNFMKSQRNKYHSFANVKKVHEIKTETKIFRNKVNLEHKHLNFQTNQLPNSNGRKYEDKVELCTSSKNLYEVNNFEQMPRVINEIYLENNADKNKLVFDIQRNNYNLNYDNNFAIASNNKNLNYDNNLAIASNNKNIPYSPILTQKNVEDNTNLLKGEHASTNWGDDDDASKRIKLNKSYWLQEPNIEYKRVNIDNDSSDASDEDVATQITPTQLENDKNPLTFIEQAQAKSSKDICKQNCDTMRNTGPVATFTHELSIEDQCSLSDKVNFDKEKIIDDEMYDSDCISLFADSAIIEECDSEKSFDVSNDVVENYYKSLKADFNKMYANNVNNNKTVVPPKIIKYHQNRISMERSSVPSSTEALEIRKKVIIPSMSLGQILFYFRGHCYEFIKTGYCNRYPCTFEHNFVPLMSNWCSRNESHLFKMLEELAAQGLTEFIKSFYSSLLFFFLRRSYNIDVNCILKIFKKLYELTIMSTKSAFYTIECIQNVEHSIKSIIEKLGSIIDDRDFDFVNWMLKILEKYIPQGQYWRTLKSLLLRVENLEPEIIETILKECINTQQDIDDININIVRKLRSDIYSKINHKILLSFKNLMKCNRNNAEEIMSSQKNETVSLPTGNSAPSEVETLSNINEYTRIPSTTDQAREKRKSGDNDFTLHPIDDLPNPYSVQGRALFSDFYTDVYNLQEGLKHNDYNRVMKILNSVKEDQKSVFSRACYQILKNEITYSPYRLGKLILNSVETGTTAVSYQIISDVATYIMADLAERGLWVLAYILLKNVYIILEPQIYSYKLDATTILLFVEIYLANEEAIEAFTLLKRTNIIFTNPDKWKVQSIDKDSAIRIQIITILSYIMSEKFPEYAFFLFEFLVTDQSSNFRPIDLTNIANVMLSKFLLRKDQELIIKTTKLIMKYNFVLKDVVCRALICTLFHFDMNLAKQLYQISTALGIYSTLQFHPTTYLIINSDWTMEEMHLAIMNLIQQFSLNIGYAIDHVSSRRCAAYLIFENIPSNKLLINSDRIDTQTDKKITASKRLMRSLLEDQFKPIRLSTHKINSRWYRLNGLSVIRYIKFKYSV